MTLGFYPDTPSETISHILALVFFSSPDHSLTLCQVHLMDFPVPSNSVPFALGFAAKGGDSTSNNQGHPELSSRDFL
jgi:hypothetical protein